jgi:hypothetical protein
MSQSQPQPVSEEVTENPVLENRYHTYSTHRIPGYVRFLWVCFYCLGIWYTLVNIFPAFREEFKLPNSKKRQAEAAAKAKAGKPAAKEAPKPTAAEPPKAEEKKPAAAKPESAPAPVTKPEAGKVEPAKKGS